MGLASAVKALHAAVLQTDAVTLHHYRGLLPDRRSLDRTTIPSRVAEAVAEGRLVLLQSSPMRILRRWRYRFSWPTSLLRRARRGRQAGGWVHA